MRVTAKRYTLFAYFNEVDISSLPRYYTAKLGPDYGVTPKVWDSAMTVAAPGSGS